jgi:hypothetical protein
MACNISMSCVIEQVHGLPQGTIAKIGGEAAAELALAIRRDPSDPLVVAMVDALTREQKP